MTHPEPWRVEPVPEDMRRWDGPGAVRVYHGDRYVDVITHKPLFGFWYSRWYDTADEAVQALIEFWQPRIADNTAAGRPEFWSPAQIAARITWRDR